MGKKLWENKPNFKKLKIENQIDYQIRPYLLDYTLGRS